MAQITRGLRSVLSHPFVYNAWAAMLGANRARIDFIENSVRPRPGHRILDLGCGTGTMFAALPADTEYVGIDISEEYVLRCRKLYGSRAQFIRAAVGEDASVPSSAFDVVLAAGILHHLDAPEVASLLALAHRALVPGGRIVTVDPVCVAGQSRAVKWLIARDRGQNVRTADAYAALLRTTFGQVVVQIRHDRLRIPYTHIVMEGTKSTEAQ